MYNRPGLWDVTNSPPLLLGWFQIILLDSGSRSGSKHELPAKNSCRSGSKNSPLFLGRDPNDSPQFSLVFSLTQTAHNPITPECCLCAVESLDHIYIYSQDPLYTVFHRISRPRKSIPGCSAYAYEMNCQTEPTVLAQQR